MIEKKRTIASWLSISLFFVLAIFLVRLFFIQVIEHKTYSEKADENQISKQTINPVRGKIYVKDKDGGLSPLVLNQTVYTVFADPTQIKDADKVSKLVKSVVGDLAIDSSFGKLKDTSTQYVVLARQVSYNQAKT